MTGRILIVDDELPIRRLLRSTLERAGYRVSEAINARDALDSLSSGLPDCVLLDLGLPDRDGLELLPLIRKQANVPVLVISAREATDDKVAALDLGAEDYVTKPFDSEELLARIRVALRHRGITDTATLITYGNGLSIDLDQRMVRRVDGTEIHLTRKEHAVLELLAQNVGRVVTHRRILAAVWGRGEDARIEYLRIVVRNLRQKLEDPNQVGTVIANELGIGYRLAADG